MNRILSVILLSILMGSCIREVDVDIRTNQPTLVVEGLLLTDTTPCSVTLSKTKSFSFNDTSDFEYIADAEVTVNDSEGNVFPLQYVYKGMYSSRNQPFTAEIGKSYFIRIKLQEGKTYISTPEKILPVVKQFDFDTVITGVPIIDNSVRNELKGAELRIKFNDPPNEINYYQWKAEAWIPRKSTGIPCGFRPPCFQDCHQYYRGDTRIRTLSDFNLNGSTVRDQPVFTSPYYFYGRHFLVVKQLSLTTEAFRFWKLYQEQLERTGSILDPLPAQITGNVYNENDPNDLALGYFQASDVYAKKMILFPVYDPLYDVLTPAKKFIMEGICHEIYPNALNTEIFDPEGWENAEEHVFRVKK